MFTEPPRTPYDLEWGMLGVPIRVHPWFWIVAALLGWRSLDHGFTYLFLWIACVFVSILIHELGHVFMGRVFGSDGHIVLYAFGGLAVGSSALASRWQRIAVYLAGPFIQLLLVVPLGWAWYNADPATVSPLVFWVLAQALLINLFWPLLNLLPIWPLDGGQACRDFLGGLMPQAGARLALGLSILVAGLIALNALTLHLSHHALPLFERVPFLNRYGGIYPALFFGWLAFGSFQALQVEAHPPWKRWDPDEDRYEEHHAGRW